MEPRQSDSEKFIDLEMKLGFVERTVEDLSEVVLAQTNLIERMERRLREIEDRAASKQDSGQQDMSDPLDERPPHY
jgi:uncharacterized coiled-coil protein SlyX